jgi:hypothetical protein
MLARRRFISALGTEHDRFLSQLLSACLYCEQSQTEYVDRQTIVRRNCPLNYASAEAQKCRDSHRGIPESRLAGQ